MEDVREQLESRYLTALMRRDAVVWASRNGAETYEVDDGDEAQKSGTVCKVCGTMFSHPTRVTCSDACLKRLNDERSARAIAGNLSRMAERKLRKENRMAIIEAERAAGLPERLAKDQTNAKQKAKRAARKAFLESLENEDDE